MLITYFKQFENLIEKFYNLWPTDKFDKDLHQALERSFSKLDIILSCYRWLAMVTVSLIVPLKPFLSGKGGLPLDMWQPFDMNVMPWYPFVYFIQSAAAYYASFVNIAVDSLFVSFLMIIITQFRMLGFAFKNLGLEYIETVQEEEKALYKIKEYVQYHNHLIRYLID